MVKLGIDAACVPKGWPLERYPTLGEAVGRYLDDLLASSVSKRTPKTYREQLWQFTYDPRRDESWGRYPDEPLTWLTEQRCRELVGLRLHHQSRNTARLFAGTLKGFCTWAQMAYGYSSPMKDVPVPKAPVTPHRYLSKAQVKAIYQACPDAEHRAMILLLLEGVRAAELLAIHWSDVTDSIRIHGKGDKPRRIAVSRHIEAILGELPIRDGRVFTFTYQTLWVRIGKLGRKAGIPFPVTPHQFRKTWASHMLLEGMDVPTVVTLGGWADDRVLKRTYAATVVQEAALSRSREMALTERLLSD